MHWPHLSTHQLMDLPVYWVFFWNAIYVLAPPRELFHSPKYNKFLDLVSYYGSLNIRGLIMKVYQAPPTGAGSTWSPPEKTDAPKENK